MIALQQIFKRCAINKLHHQEIALILRKEVCKSRQGGMTKHRKHLCLNSKILNGKCLLLWWHHREAHLFNSTQRALAFHVLCLINSPHAPLTNHLQDHIAFMEQSTWNQLTSGVYICMRIPLLADCRPPFFASYVPFVRYAH